MFEIVEVIAGIACHVSVMLALSPLTNAIALCSTYRNGCSAASTETTTKSIIERMQSLRRIGMHVPLPGQVDVQPPPGFDPPTHVPSRRRVTVFAPGTSTRPHGW